MIQIVVLPMRWVVVGRVSREGQDVVIRDPSIVRHWGTKGAGLGGLTYGPQPAREGARSTQLDPCPTIRVHELTVLFTVDVDQESWEPHLLAPPRVPPREKKAARRGS